MLQNLKNKTVMIRTLNAGVHFGILHNFIIADGVYYVELHNSTRVFSWEGACSLSELSQKGTKRTDSRFSVQVPSIYLAGIEVIEMTAKAIESINKIKLWKYEKKV